MDLPLPPTPPKSAPSPFGLASVCGLLTELEDVGRVVALSGFGQEARRLPFLCASLARDDELLLATRTAVYGGRQRTRLMYAARAGDVRRVTALLRPRDAEREVDAVDAEGRTALHHASASGRVEVVRLLLDKGADKDKEDTHMRNRFAITYWRPLHYASAAGDKAMVRLLLERGAATDPDEEPIQEQPLHVACRHGHVEVVRLLLHAGAYQDAWDNDLRTPYIVAVGQGQEAVVNLLLDCGQQVDGETEGGGIRIHTALNEAGQESMVRLLLGRGADVDARATDGETPLHAAVGYWSGSVALTRLFVERGADYYAMNVEGETPYVLATEALERAEAMALVDPQVVPDLLEIIGIYDDLRAADDAVDWVAAQIARRWEGFEEETGRPRQVPWTPRGPTRAAQKDGARVASGP
jgi:ankyrin repeat protein